MVLKEKINFFELISIQIKEFVFINLINIIKLFLLLTIIQTSWWLINLLSTFIFSFHTLRPHFLLNNYSCGYFEILEEVFTKIILLLKATKNHWIWIDKLSGA